MPWRGLGRAHGEWGAPRAALSQPAAGGPLISIICIINIDNVTTTTTATTTTTTTTTTSTNNNNNDDNSNNDNNNDNGSNDSDNENAPSAALRQPAAGGPAWLLSFHLLRVSLLRVLESNFPGDSLYNYTDMRIPTP